LNLSSEVIIALWHFSHTKYLVLGDNSFPHTPQNLFNTVIFKKLIYKVSVIQKHIFT